MKHVTALIIMLALLHVIKGKVVGGNNTILSNEKEQLVLCTKIIVHKYFIPNRTLLVSSSGYDSELLDILLRNLNEILLCPLHISLPESRKIRVSHEHREVAGSYVILAKDRNDFVEQADRLLDSPLWNPRARFIVAVSVPDPNPQSLARDIIQELWDTAWILEVLVILPFGKKLELYTAFPFKDAMQCKNITEVLLLNKWVMEGEGKFVDDVDMFPEKISTNFHGCEIIATTADPGGEEDKLINEIMRRLNLTITYVSVEENLTLYEKIESAVSAVVFGSAHIAYGAIPLIMEAATVADPSFPYYEVKYCFYVPCSKPLPRLKRISKIFTLSLWVTVCGTIILVSVIVWLLSNKSRERNTYSHFSSSLYNIWAVIMGASVTEMPRTFSLRFLIFSWICYCFAITTVFQTFFTSYLVDPGFEKQIRSVDELLKSGIGFGHRSDFNIFYESSLDGKYQELLRRRQDCTPVDVCIDRIIETGRFSTLGESWLVEGYLNDIHEHSLVCNLNTDYFSVLLSTYFRKGFSFIDLNNRLIMASVESGLVVKTDRDRLLGKYSPSSPDVFDEFFVFTTAHLHVAFYALAIGYSLSFLCFLGEIIYSLKYKKN